MCKPLFSPPTGNSTGLDSLFPCSFFTEEAARKQEVHLLDDILLSPLQRMPTNRLPPGYTVEAMMVNRTLHLDFKGEPPIQARTRSTYIRSQGRLLVYDPSSTIKSAVKVLLTAALQELGQFQVPLFPAGRRITVTAKFTVRDPRKDVDNMLKLLLDVMQGIVFNDDRFVYSVTASK